MSRPPMSWVLGTFYSPPSDWAAAPLAACTAASNPLPLRGFTRGSIAAARASENKVGLCVLRCIGIYRVIVGSHCNSLVLCSRVVCLAPDHALPGAAPQGPLGRHRPRTVAGSGGAAVCHRLPPSPHHRRYAMNNS